MENQIFTEENNGQEVTVYTGSVFTLELKENPTTGFQWVEDEIPADCIELLSRNYIPDPREGMRAGAGGKVYFELRALAAGTTSLSFKYLRAFEGDSSISRRFRLTLNIQD